MDLTKFKEIPEEKDKALTIPDRMGGRFETFRVKLRKMESHYCYEINLEPIWQSKMNIKNIARINKLITCQLKHSINSFVI